MLVISWLIMRRRNHDVLETMYRDNLKEIEKLRLEGSVPDFWDTDVPYFRMISELLEHTVRALSPTYRAKVVKNNSEQELCIFGIVILRSSYLLFTCLSNIQTRVAYAVHTQLQQLSDI